jgi:hypothetical protein
MAEEHPTKQSAGLFEGVVARDHYPFDHRSWERGWATPVGVAVGAIIGTFRPKREKPEEAING